ncbi:hypothetical protein [Psychromonas aquimarina]|uniref:hypothetical protein n=1 Tax=Psychromonas aquimarina TaxID=444919 RepID=UPI0006841003|nr:hypothetical protein [Psychromonas aquimarina]
MSSSNYITKKIVLCLYASILMFSSNMVQAVEFDISWKGASGYSMKGYFSYDDSLIGTGAIGAAHLDTFYIDVLHNGLSIGTWDFVLDGLNRTAFVFNFDTNTEKFNLGGKVFSSKGQYWNMAGTKCNGAGFQSSPSFQLVCANGAWITDSLTRVSESALVATRTITP